MMPSWNKGRMAAALALLAGLVLTSPGKETRPAPAPGNNLGVLKVLRPRVPVPIHTANLTFQVGEKLPLFQQNDACFIALTTTDYEGARLVAVPRESRGGRLAWVSTDQTLIFAYPTMTCEGTLYLREGERLAVARETSAAYEVTVQRFGRQAKLWVPKTTRGIEFRQEDLAPGLAAETVPATGVALTMVTNQDGKVSMYLDPGAARRLDRLRVLTPGVPVPISNPSVTFYIGDDLPLFQQNDTEFVALVNTEYDGLRLCAFPVVLQYARTAWVSPEKTIIFAYATPSREGTMYLRQGEELPVIGSDDENYEVVIERFGRQAKLSIPKTTPGLGFVKAPPPPPPPKPKPVKVTRIVASGPQSFTNEPGSAASSSSATATETNVVILQEAPTMLSRISSVFSRMVSRDRPAASNVVSGTAATETAAAASPAPVSAPVSTPTQPEEPAKPEPTAPAETNASRSIASFLTPRQGLSSLLLAFATQHSPIVAGSLALVLIVAGLGMRSRQLAARLPPPAAPAPKPAPAAPAKAPAAAPAPAPAAAPAPAPAPAAATAPGVAPAAPADFSGSISSMSLGAVTQFLNSDKESGTLTIRDERGTDVGKMIFVKGEILDATSPGKRGVDAVYDILHHRQGQFAFVRGENPKLEKTIKQGTISVLLDAHRVMDEKAPPSPAPGPKSAGKHAAPAAPPKPIGMPKKGGTGRH